MKKVFSIAAFLELTSCFLASTVLAGTAYLSWQENTEPDLKEYRVYHGTSSRIYGPPVSVGRSTGYAVNGLTENITHYFSVTAVDMSGNESDFSAEVTKTIRDAEPPSIEIISPNPEGPFVTSKSILDLSGSALDNVGVIQVLWSDSQGRSGTAQGTTNWSVSNLALAQGSSVITVRAKDAAGNEAEASLTATYTPKEDKTAPSVGIMSPTEKSIYITRESTIDLSGLAWDDVAVTKVTWVNSAGGGGTASGTDHWVVSGIKLSKWQNVITVTAVDGAGNLRSNSLKVICLSRFR